MLAEITQRATGIPFRDHLSKVIFEPTGMVSTHLGWRDEYKSRNVAVKVTDPEETGHWNHNSPYWRDIGSPWGGVHTNTTDIARLMQLMLDGGTAQSGTSVFGPGTVRMMLHDYTLVQPGLSEAARLREGWGFGWRIHRVGDEGWYGSAVPPGAFGHVGDTGTATWADPVSGVIFVLLTNGLRRLESATLKACGNIVASALC